MLTLAALTTFAPLSVDMYLPAMPTIATELSASASNIQLSLSLFLGGYAGGQLAYGPLSDRFGRRLPLLAGVVLYILTSVGCALAGSVDRLILLRLLQALGACAGTVLSRAMVRDLFGKEEAARLFSIMILITGVAPMFAPIIGGQILVYAGWRAIFWVLAAFGVFSLVFAWRLQESHPVAARTSYGAFAMLKSYGTLLKNRRFVGYTLCQGFVFSGMFAYISGSPFVFIELFGIPPDYYGLLFAFHVTALMTGAAINNRLIPKFGTERMLTFGVINAAVIGTLLIAVGITGSGGLVGVVLLCWLFMPSVTLVSSNALTGGLSEFPRLTGTAAAVMGAAQFGVGGVFAYVVGLLHDGTVFSMTVVIGTVGLAALLTRFLLVPPRGR